MKPRRIGSNILACPFCGEKASFVDGHDHGYVECSTCGARSGGYVYDDTASFTENRRATIAEWNRRHRRSG